MRIIRPVPVTQAGTFTRASTGTYWDKNGVLQTAVANTLRVTYDPTDLTKPPYALIEPAATNLFLNSDVAATQNITTAAGNYTLSFEGTGSVTLSGAATGTVNGVAVGRASCTVTALAGTVTLTITGTVTRCQFEAGSKATSYIAATTAAAQRAADAIGSTGLIYSNVPENDYPVWSSATTYPAKGRVIDLASHKVYESIAANNTNHPVTDVTYWLDAGYDNRWDMFDQSVTSQTAQAGDVTICFNPGTRFDSVIGLNAAASKAKISVTDNVSGAVLYSATVSMTANSGISNWFSYFYEPIVQRPDFLVDQIPVGITSGSTVTVNFTSTGTVKVGGLLFGLSKDIGITDWGAKVGQIDYSIKSKDTFGNYTITPRAFSKRGDFTVQVPTDSVDYLQNLLSQYRATPIVYVGSNTGGRTQFNSMIIYGFYKDFDISVAYNAYSVCSISIEGLT